MPHFLAKDITLPTMPFSSGDFSFLYALQDIKDSNSYIIKVCHNGLDSSNVADSTNALESSKSIFFLHYIKRAKNSIIKCDKRAKSAPTGIIKNALKILASYQPSLISHNLDNNTIRQSLKSPFLKEMSDFVGFSAPCFIEIGFGSGRHLLHLAQSNSDTMCIGVEIHTPSIEQILRQIALLKLKNCFIIRGDARILLEILAPNVAKGIFLHFPVPWHKAPNRRVISPKFLANALRVLDSSGRLHVRSDDSMYANYTQNLAQDTQGALVEAQVNSAYKVISKYEARWQRQQKDIYDIFITKSSAFKPPSGKSAKSQNDMNITKILRKNVNKAIFPYKKMAKDWFLHIERVYALDDIYVLALAFGDFEYPQHKLLELSFCNGLESGYINGSALPTSAAIKAHRHLCEILR